jgi:hypothetical protein
MDNAVALVQAYLRVNGYFTVAEYPVVEAAGHRSLTDLDILAFRFPHARHHSSDRGGRQTVDAEVFTLDPALGRPGDLADMLVGEVKEGRVRLNAAARDPAVLRAGLTRFGCCTPEEAPQVVAELGRVGHAKTHSGHEIRLVAFGSILGEKPVGYTSISLGHVVAFLQDHLRRHWDIVRHVQTKEPVLGFLLMLEKALRGLEGFDAERAG